MEISVGNSGGSKTRSLDLKTLYKSEVSNKGAPVNKGKSSWLGNGEEAETKKRKNRKEAAISSFEDLTERKKIRPSINDIDIEIDGADTCSTQPSGIGQKINGGSGFNAVGMNIGGDGHGILIPKRPRGSVGRSKFAKNHLLKPAAASGSVEKVAKLKDDLEEVMQNEVSSRGEPVDSNSSAELNVKLNGKSGVKARRKQKGVVGLKGSPKQELATVTSSQHAKSDSEDLVKPTGSLGSKDQVTKLKYEIKEIPQDKVPGADAHLSNSSLGSQDQVDKLIFEVKEISQNKFPGADAPLSSISTYSDQMGKINENSKGKLRNNVKKKGIDDQDGNQKQKEDLAVAGSSQLVMGEGTDLVVNNKDSSSKRNSSNRRKRKMLGSGSETVSKKVESSIEKKVGTCDLDPDDDLEQNAARMLSSRFDPSCTGFASRNRTSALSSPNGVSLLEKPTANIGSEGPMVVSDPASADTADRVLRPRRQQKGKGTSRKRRHFYEIHSDDMDAHWFLNRRIKIFWPLDESWYYGLVNDYDAEKNLHHIKYDDRDEEWISLENERFKLLLLPSEVPHKTSRKDTGSVDTHKEGIKEFKGSRAFHMNDETFMASHMESEPIISWLARSSHRVKSSPSTSLKKQKLSHFPSKPLQLSDNPIDVYNGNMGLLERETDKTNCSDAFLNISVDRRKNEESVPESTNSSEGHPIVYVRRRYRRFSDAAPVLFMNSNGCLNPSGHSASLSRVLQSSADGSNFLSCLGPGELHWSLNSAGALKSDTTFLESKKFTICISLWPMLTYILGVDILWLIHSVLLLQYGTMVTMWPTVVLEVLFIDNIVGLRLFIFEGCLKQAVAFVFLVMKVFCEPEKDKSTGLKVPMTSIRFKLSFFQNLIKQKVFTYYSFSKVRDSNWQYLDSELQPHCLLTKQLSLPECTYDNIKLLEAMQHSQLPYAGQTTYFEVSHKRSNPGAVPLVNRSISSYPVSGCRPSTIYSSKHGNLPPFALSFTAAPNFFLSLHLKLLLERSITAVSLQDHDSAHSLHYPRDTFHPLANDCSHGEDQFEIFSESSCNGHEKMSSFEAAGSGVVCTSSRLCKDAAVISIDGGLKKSSQLVLDAKLNVNRTSISFEAAQTVPVEIGNSDKYEANVKDHALPAVSGAICSSNLKGISVEIPTSDEVYRDCRKTPGAQQVSDLTWNLSDGIICSPNPTGPRSLWHRNKSGLSSSSFGDPLHAWPDGKVDYIGNGFGNGPKKPRTQVQYTLPSREFNFKNKGHNQTGLPYQRIRKANDKRTSDSSKGPRRNLELVACDANILINGGDKGWRECGARVFLEVADQNEWKLAVKCSGELRYSYKVHQDLQPGSTNRYTHAMMWKGGKDWALEFPDRSQWFLFKEMHEECHNRNIRAASIKNIPIPGVRLIEDSVDDQEEMPFIRSPWYFRQVRNDVEMAMDGSHVIYDMDSEDEEWITRSRVSCQTQGGEDDVISHEIFEKVMDMLEKVSYAQKRDHFTSGEIDELIARVSPIQVAKSIYEHWREKRLRKGMPLIRQLQPPLWERYQQICREWDELNPKITTGSVSGSLEKASAGDKPPMFAFCLKPRGLELLNKGSKHRPHKKISLSGHSHAFLGDHDSHHSSGRRVNAYALGDESSDVSPLLNKMYSPRDPGHLSLDAADSSADWNHQLRIQRHSNSKSIRAAISPNTAVAPPSTLRKSAATGNGKRSNGKKLNNNAFGDWHHNQPNRQLLLGGSDLDEFRLRDASSAAKHARNMAKLKRERAQKLMLSADLAIHKAVSALMTAEAIKACNEAASYGRSTKSTRSLPPSPS